MCRNGLDYVQYKGKVTQYIDEWGFPSERQFNIRQEVWISPIWPALFSLKMPKEVRETWLNLKQPIKSEIYCPILWKTYVDNQFPTRGIPYLQSRRRIYYRFKTPEMKTMRKLEMLRIETGLIRLTRNIREIMKLWKNKTEGDWDEVSVDRWKQPSN